MFAYGVLEQKVELPVGQSKICHSDLLMSWGSCFSENIGKLLVDNKFNCDINLLAFYIILFQ
mgnify:CR=1 FL=1